MNIFQWSSMLSAGVMLSAVGFINPTVAEEGRQLVNEKFPVNLPDPQTLTEAVSRSAYYQQQFEEAMLKQGVSSKWQELYKFVAKQHLSPVDYFSALRRGLIDSKEYDSLMNTLKFDETDRKIAEKVMTFFPTPSDLVTFAVREVYSPEITRKFGQFDDLPEMFLKEAYKTGMDEEQARNYWASHWDLPSSQMGFEMLHRGVINEEELAMLLRALDVMPFWREKLIKISYNPLTRVDVRRMYLVGVLKEEDVYRAYLDEGYSPENARRLTDFTIKYENPDVESITRASVVSAYKKDIITKDELTQYFKLLNYNENVLNFWLENADYEKTLDSIEKYTQDITDRYIMGDIDISDVRKELSALDVPSNYIDAVVNDTLAKSAKKTKVPTLDDLRRWLQTGLVEESYFVRKMRLLGYRDADIELYLSEISSNKDTSEVKYLPIETYVRWVKNGVISPERFLKILSDQGVKSEKIQEYLQKAGVG